MTNVVLVLAGIPFVMLSLAWWFHERTKQSGWIDVIWTAAVGLAGVAGALAGHDGAPGERAMLYAGLVAVWSLRLGSHLFRRTLRVPDDPRYVKLRQVWGEKAASRMYAMLMYQAFAAAVMATAAAAAAHASDLPIGVMDTVAVLLFVAALVGETAADAQMRRFRADPANHGGVCDTGLWAWSRHPNYFFECLGWCAFAVGALAEPGLALLAALPGPILMVHLLLNVSGVPMLEKYMRATRGAAWDAYAARVSKFVPRPPRG